MAKNYAGVFYIGITTVPKAKGVASRMIVTSTSSVSTASTYHRAALPQGGGNIEIELGGPLHATALQDAGVGVQVFDAHFMGPESRAAALIKKAQALFEDPDAFVESGEIDRVYRDNLLKFKKQVTHCVVSVLRVRVS